MKVPDFFKWAEETFNEEMSIMQDKGKEYTISNEDKLKNFKSIAERTHSDPKLVLCVYLLKHIDSICNYVVDGREASDEAIEGRLMDARNYLLLLGAIIKEERQNNGKG